MRQHSGLLALTLLLSGCYSWTAIKPTELPKLNGVSSTSTLGTGGRVTLLTVAQVEAPDGRLVEIKGESNARVSIRGRGQMLFQHPVLTAVDANDLVIRSANQGKTTIPLLNIQSVEVSQSDPSKVIVPVVVLSSLLCTVAALVVLSQ